MTELLIGIALALAVLATAWIALLIMVQRNHAKGLARIEARIVASRSETARVAAARMRAEIEDEEQTERISAKLRAINLRQKAEQEGFRTGPLNPCRTPPPSSLTLPKSWSAPPRSGTTRIYDFTDYSTGRSDDSCDRSSTSSDSPSPSSSSSSDSGGCSSTD